VPELTIPQLHIVRLLVAGYKVREIAGELDLKPSTVYEHLANIRRRLGVRTLPEVAVYAVRHRLV
jgi:DNA-binding NarL/FixJ family response regulator